MQSLSRMLEPASPYENTLHPDFTAVCIRFSSWGKEGRRKGGGRRGEEGGGRKEGGRKEGGRRKEGGEGKKGGGEGGKEGMEEEKRGEEARVTFALGTESSYRRYVSRHFH